MTCKGAVIWDRAALCQRAIAGFQRLCSVCRGSLGVRPRIACDSEEYDACSLLVTCAVSWVRAVRFQTTTNKVVLRMLFLSLFDKSDGFALQELSKLAQLPRNIRVRTTL